MSQQGTNQILDCQICFGSDSPSPVGSRSSVVSEVVEDTLRRSTLPPGRHRCNRAVLISGSADLRRYWVKVIDNTPPQFFVFGFVGSQPTHHGHLKCQVSNLCQGQRFLVVEQQDYQRSFSDFVPGRCGLHCDAANAAEQPFQISGAQLLRGTVSQQRSEAVLQQQFNHIYVSIATVGHPAVQITRGRLVVNPKGNSCY